MSIVRIGLAETKNFADGYDVIFSGRKVSAPKKAARPKARPAKKKVIAKKKSAKKK